VGAAAEGGGSIGGAGARGKLLTGVAAFGPAFSSGKSDMGAVRLWAFLLLLLAGAVSGYPQSGGGPENVLVVVNKSSAISRRVGEYYIQKRRIPLQNLCVINTHDQDDIERAEYDSRIARPIAQFLAKNKLRDQILYIVLTQGIPLRVGGASDDEIASVDSELTLLYSDMTGKPRTLKGAAANPFFGQRQVRFEHPRFPIYLVTRLGGYDFKDIQGMIDRSLEAANRGWFVFDMRSASDDDGDNWLRTAAIFLPKERVILDESSKVLTGIADVIGFASWGSNDRARTQRFLGMKWLPGAIVTDYVSENGRTMTRPPDDWQIKKSGFAGSKQNLTADYIHEGATGAAGHVSEPYLYFTPRPDLLFPAYYSGRNLAESYYLSIRGLSWTNIFLGDPLCTIGKPR
jgi:uncharacterized protein (TIGR03790 family)